MNQCVFEKMIPGTEEGIAPGIRGCARGALFDNYGKKPFIDVAEGKLSLDDFMEQLSDDDLIHLLAASPIWALQIPSASAIFRIMEFRLL